MTIYDAMGLFIEDRCRRGVTDGSRQTYWQQFSYLAQWLAVRAIAQIEDITADQLIAYLESIRTRPKRDTTKQGHLSHATVRHWALHIRIFFKFLYDEGHLKQPVYKHIPVPRKSTRQLPKVLTPEQVRRLLKLEMSTRDRALVTLMLDSALRLGEVCALNVADVDFETMTVFVRHGKGDKARYAVFSEQTVKQLKAWLVEREAILCACDIRTAQEPALFLSADPSQERTGMRLLPSGLSAVIKRLALRAGLKGILHPHVLRHTSITLYLDAGGSLQDAAKQAGHNDIATTMIYTHVAVQSLARKHVQFSPLKNFGEVAA